MKSIRILQGKKLERHTNYLLQDNRSIELESNNYVLSPHIA